MALKTFAAIDVGSFELAMKIFEISPRVGLKEIDDIRHRIDLGTDTYTTGKISNERINELCEVNPFGVLALQAAYNEGEPWLKELNEYLYGNYRALLSFFEENLPEFPVSKLEGTYLVWVDVSALNMSANDIENSLLLNEKVWINSGVMYGLDGFMRINIACPRKTLAEGLERIRKVVG